MSGFLTNLLRRGAGLPPLVAPRRMDLPAELPVDLQAMDGEPEEWEAQDVLSPAIPATPEPERGRLPEAAPSPAPAPVTVKAAEAEAARAAPVLSVESQAVQAPQAPVPEIPERAPERSAKPVPSPPPSPRQDRPREPKETVRVLAPPQVIPPSLPVRLETLIERIAAPPGEHPLPAPEPLPLAPIAPPTISPPPERPAALQALDEAQPPEEPRIEVRIGRVEIRQATPPPPPAPAPRREPRGFPDHSLARRYLDRRY